MTNSTAKGTAFERVIAGYFDREIAEGRMHFRPECVQVFQRRRYFSRDRRGDIEFDVAIEASLPGASTFSERWLIECKDYQSAVPVSDVEEFFSKVQQVGAANTKAVVAAAGAFQEGALRFAESKGVGLLRYFGPDQLDWVLNRVASRRLPKLAEEEIRDGLLRDDARACLFPFYGFAVGRCTTSVREIMVNLPGPPSDPGVALEPAASSEKSMVPHLDSGEIERRVESLLDGIGYQSGPVPLETIYRREEGNGLIVDDREPNEVERSSGVLGRIDLVVPSITLFRYPEIPAGRKRFTLAHELGHYFLSHGLYLLSEDWREDEVYDPSDAAETDDLRKLEFQANRFASYMLLPRRALRRACLQAALRFDLRDRGHGLIYLDDQECNRQIHFEITDLLAKEFLASRQAISVSLREMGLLTDARAGRLSSLRPMAEILGGNPEA